jgi:hypothetical protein
MLPELLFFKNIPMRSWICLISLPFGQVLDEADRLLNEDFEESLNEILGMIPRERRTFLFSATMTKKVKM